MITRARTFLLCATLALTCWSAYAADKNGVSPNTISVPKGPGSVEGLGESFQPLLNTGTAKYGVRLIVPPGTGAHAPTLALQYDGGGGNGILGFGWSLPMPFIQRQTDHGIPTYGASVGFARNDRFINELKEELVPAADGNFFCKNEGAFVRYRQVGDHWEGTTPTGTRMEFGVTPQAQVRNGTNVFSWLLERQTDARGNTITFSYTAFPGENNTNQIYLHAVRYGPGVPSWTNYHFIRFHYESRPDWFEDCRPGFEVRTGQRLKRIDIGTQGPDLPGSQRGDFDSDSREDNLVRRYLLQYATNGTASHWSLLASVTQIGSDGVTGLPPARFDYLTCDPPDFVSGLNQVIGSENTPPFVMDNALVDLVDLNGDGLPDLLKTDAGGGIHTAYSNLGQRRVAAGQHILWDGGVQITGDPGAQVFDLQSDENTGTHSAHLADMDGDGAADFAVKAGSDNVFYFANQNNRRWGPRSQMTVADIAPPAPFGSPEVRTADVDFDKRVDIIRSLGAGLGYHVWFNLGDNAYSDRVLVESDSDFSFDFSSPAVQIADLNGDRVPDVAQIQPAAITVTTGLGYGRFAAARVMQLPGGIFLNAGQLSRARLTDLNGDGLADLVVERAEGSDLWYWINLGIYAFDEQRTITGLPVPTGSAAQIRWVDMNGNGTVDYAFADRESVPQIQTVDLGELIGCGSYRNLLNSVANGIGRITQIGYESATHFRLLDAAAGRPWPDPIPFAVPVISAITNLDSMGHAYITRFRYHDGYYDPEGKQFRGFARVEQIDVGDSTAPTLISRSFFDTGRSFEAMKGKQLRESFETEDGRVFCDVFTAWQIPPRVLVLGTNGHSVSYTHPVGSTNVIKELGQGIERRVESEFAYDQFGNQTVQRDYGIVENPNRRAFNDERFTITQYAINTNAWIVRHPKRREILDADDKVISRTDFFYDDETFSTNNFGFVTIGNLTLKHEWIFPSLRTNVIRSTRAKYDSYGNTTTIMDPLAVHTGDGEPQLESGHVRTIGYDSRFHTYPVSETVHIGHGSAPLVYRANYHEGFGTVTSTLDFNQNTTGYDYDEFARLAHIIRPGDSAEFPTVEYSYVLAVPHAGSNLVNYVETRQLDQPTNDAVPKLDLYFILRQFTDGLGRKLLTKREAGPFGSEGGNRVVVSGATTFNQRQVAGRIFNPFFSRLSGSLEQRLEFESVEQNTWVGDFQSEGQLVTLNSSNAHSTMTHYDAILRAIQTVNPDGTTRAAIFEPLVSRSFDENDRDESSPHFNTPVLHYQDGLGRLVRVDEITRLNDDGTSSNTLRAWTTRYEYDVNDRLTRILDAQNNLKEFSFDGLQRMTFMKDLNRGDMGFTYDDGGNLLERTDAKLQRITYTYDGANRIRTEDYHDEGQAFSANLVYDPTQPLTRSNRADVVYFYDSAATGLPAGDGTIARARNTAGQLAYIWDLSGEDHTSYDERGRVEWRVKRLPEPHFEVPLNAEPSTTLVSYRTGFSYDSLNRITGITYPDNDAVTYEFDARTLPARIVGSAAGATIISSITYWPSDQQAEITYGNGVRTTYKHDDRQRLKALNTSRVTAPDLPVIAFGYHFDGVSNIRRIDDHRSASAAPEGSPRRNTQLFDYDDAYRLRRVQHSFALPAEPARNDGEITYRYDRIGNLLAQRSTIQHVEKGVPITDLGSLSYGGVSGASGRVGRGASDPPGPHALTAIDSVATGNNSPRRFEYDPNGNMTVMNGFTNTWDFKDRLVAVENADLHARYTFDHNDRRVLKRVDDKNGSAVMKHRSNLTTLYPDNYFEVREHDAPTKFVFNGDTRVAQVTGSISNRERIQRLRVHAGWNFIGVAVTSTTTFANQDPVLRSALRWNSSMKLWGPVLAEETLAAGTVLAVNATTNAIVSLRGAYADPVQPPVNLDGDFQAIAGLERWDIATTDFPTSAVLWRYDPTAQGWMATMATALPPVLTPPISLSPGETVFVLSDMPAALELPSPALRILFYHQDHIGSTSAVTDKEGTVIEETSYYAFGFPRLQIQQTPTRRPYKFAQKELDVESGRSYFEARFLAPSINRFLSVDAAALGPPELQNPQTLNVYSYAANRPITHGDPTGNQTAPVAEPKQGSTPQADLKPVEIVADEQSWSDWFWEIYGTVFGGVVEAPIKVVPAEGVVPYTESDAEFHVNFQEGTMETEKMLKHADPLKSSNIEEYQRIKGLSHADHIKEFHPDAAAKPEPTKKPPATPIPPAFITSGPSDLRSQAERDATIKFLDEPGRVPGY